MKHQHEFRDPIHTFISVRGEERRVIDSIPFQRLRHIHQLALTYLVYPGTTHKRFEHSLGVMELSSRIFDIVTDERNIFHDSVRAILPDADGRRYWRSVLRMAALCHDIGHLPFSHAAENELLPKGFDHERLSINLIESEHMRGIWDAMRPPLNRTDIIKLAVGPKKADHLEFTTWEAVLAEIITGDAFGADRMDYLLRDAYHAGVQYGHFDHHRLLNSLRILPTLHQGSEEPALGLEDGGLESSEGLMLARHFMYKQVYMHPIRRVYDIHLKDFLKSWIAGGFFSTDLAVHLALTDSEVLSAIGAASRWDKSPHHVFARRIQFREHFRRFYSASPADRDGGKLIPGKAIAQAAEQEFGPVLIRHDYYPPKIPAPEFPVRRFDGDIESSLKLSSIRRYGKGTMMPAPGSAEYEVYNEWLHYSEGSAMLPLMLHLYVSRLKEAGAPLHPRIDSEMANHLGYVDGALKGREFFVGSSLTGADIQMSFVGEMAKIFDKLAPYPNLSAWLSRMHARPAFQRSIGKGGAYRFV